MESEGKILVMEKFSVTGRLLNPDSQQAIDDDIVQKIEKSICKVSGTEYAVDLWNLPYENGRKYLTGQKRFYCIDCGKSFTRNSSLIVHQRIHTGEKLFMCAECGKKFGLKSSLVRHMRTHTPKTLNICPDCGKSFTNYSRLFQHQKLHRKERPHKCTYCNKSFAQASQLIVHEGIHKRTELPERSEFEGNCGNLLSRPQKLSVCLQCGKSFRDTSSLKRHQRTHRAQTACTIDRAYEYSNGVSVDGKREYNLLLLKNKPHSGDNCFLCIDCGKSFTRKSSLIVHQRVHTGEKHFMCTECGKRFGLKSSLVRHTRTHSSKVLNICPDCGKCFGRYSSLFQHLKVHKREKPYKCPHCQKTFSRSSLLVVHMRTHKVEILCPKSEPTEDCDYQGELSTYGREYHICPECGKHFRKKSAFIKHQRIHIDTNTRTYSKHIYTSDGYKEVQKNEHYDVLKNFSDEENNSYMPLTIGNDADGRVSSEAKRFLCIDCGKSFTRKSSLIVHHRIHTGEKLFVCAECGKRFGLKSSLVRHTRTHSPNVQNICSDCGKCFSRYSSFFQHQKVHKKDKAYTYPHYQKKFSRTSQYVAQQKIHKEKLCPKSDPDDNQDSCETNCMQNPESPGSSEIQDWENVNNSKSLSTTDGKLKLLQSDSTEGKTNNAVSDESTGVKSGECTIDIKTIPNQRSSSSRKPYHCIQCGKNFTRKSSLIVHQRIHTGERLFMCTECGKRFSFKSSLVRHQKIHNGKILNVCSLCGIYFSRYGDLLLHLENHKDEQQIEPTEEHSQNTDEVETTVPLVKEQESAILQDKAHRPDDNDCHHPITSLPINGYKNPQSVDTMEKIQTSESIKQEIPEKLTVGGDLDSNKNQEIITYPYLPDWGVEFDFSKSFIEESSKKVERMDESEMNSQQKLLNEMSNGTSGINLSDWTQQIYKTTQSGEKRVLCTECGKSFTRKSSLIVHQRIHTGEKLFMCTQCGKRFGLKSSMVRHMRTHSSASFTCTGCGKSFRDHSKFLQHQSCHTSEWPYTDLSVDATA